MPDILDSGPTQGAHNSDFHNSALRILEGNQYKDLSTVWVTPTPGTTLDLQVVFQSWLALAMPMNQKVQRLGIARGEVGKAYNAAVEMILRDSIQWKYMLTVETDNLPPRDGLLKLYESVDKFDVIGGLYWMKGPLGTAHIYGRPPTQEDPDREIDFKPQVPLPDQLQPCNGLGMGFTLFNVDMFRQIEGPWFKTVDKIGESGFEGTQDLFFFHKAGKAGYKFACDTRVKVGHIDFESRKIW
jgi:hypothetical protein